MFQPLTKEKRILEISLILVCLGLACLLYVMEGYKMVILNMFFLPVVLGAFFLGRYRAGVLALFSAISASLVIAIGLHTVTSAASPLIIALAVTVWAAVLGLTGMLVGTLSDDRATKARELHEAYVGVIEVLSQYLQSAQPRLKAQSIRVAELSQEVALAMKLSPRQIDDIRVAALLYNMGNIEVTTQVIRRAVGTFEAATDPSQRHTFQGMDLMLSLGSVLSGAIPLLLNQDQEPMEPGATSPAHALAEIPAGAQIIRTARAYLALASDGPGGPNRTTAEVFEILRNDHAAEHDPTVLRILQQIVARTAPSQNAEDLQEVAAV